MTTMRQHEQEGLGQANAGRERTCVVTRQAAPAEDLIRFSVDPSSNTVVPDIKQVLPGRGTWIGCCKSLVTQAIERSSFARGFKAPVVVPPDLAELVESLLEKRALQSLAIANKAGLVVAGQTKVDGALQKGSVAVLLQASDASEQGKLRVARKYQSICRELGCRAIVVEQFSIEQLSLALGRSNVVHGALAEGSATLSFVQAAERLERYRSATPFESGAEISNEDSHLAAAETARVSS